MSRITPPWLRRGQLPEPLPYDPARARALLEAAGWRDRDGDGKTMMEFEANPDFYRGRPRIERVVLKFGELSLTEILSGNVDVLPYRTCR